MSDIIRKATLDDIEDLLKIENECFVDPWKRKDLDYELMENPINEVLVLEKDMKLIGFIDYMITFNSATISQIAILPPYRGKGYARSLLDAMEKSFPKDDIDNVVETITLEVRVSNEKAINLYEKNGYEKVTIKPKYYSNGEDALYMVKRLLVCQ